MRVNREFDTIDEGESQVIIAGFGRFGQIVGRMLFANGIRAVVLDHDPEQIEMLRKFGYRVFYGDATRLVARAGFPGTILIDQGTADKFLEGQLLPQRFIDACAARGMTAESRRRLEAIQMHEARLLLAHGANAAIADRNGVTPLAHARSRGRATSPPR